MRIVSASPSLPVRAPRPPGASARRTSARGARLVLVALLLAAGPSAAGDPDRLTIANSASWVPYSYLDAAGEPAGVLIDLWRLFGERNDVEIEFLLLDWADSLEAVRDGRADVHGGLSPSARRAADFDFTTPILRASTLLFVAEDTGIAHLEDTDGARLGVVAGSAAQAFTQTHFPAATLRPFANSELMLIAALAGEIEGFIADYATGLHRLVRADAVARFEAVDALYTEAVDAAVRAGERELLAFIENGLARIDPAERAAAEWRWLVPQEQLPPWLLPATGGMCLGIVIAAIAFHYLTLRRAVAERTRTLEGTVADLARLNAELDRRAHVDALTGVANRQRFRDTAEREMVRAQRYGRPLTLALIDLDRFKAINDRYGHVVGDDVLRRLADSGTSKLRAGDLLARLGGDEFAILLPETSPELARQVLERLVNAVRAAMPAVDGGRLAIDLSVGIAGYRGGDSLEDWLRRADEALYLDKARGSRDA